MVKEQDRPTWDEMQRDAAPDELEQAQEEAAHWKQRAEAAEAEAARLRGALEAADAAINPKDRSGISMHVWNERLRAATKLIRQALKDKSDVVYGVGKIHPDGSITHEVEEFHDVKKPWEQSDG